MILPELLSLKLTLSAITQLVIEKTKTINSNKVTFFIITNFPKNTK
ncbi:hypothetical protein FLJC2902T_06940 [Flavobacterium limnosediminis JC2902]|uniref:Uncharacterized protein n=1 Tax=Flavobacterium limnosediminis JC2902 TaxID=1341181 RepID=V6SRH0_9FLAO|nr:hypothetical protein FLJC2902T_06940 [Flavobacterium limnosediminis JC2902]